MGSQDRYSDRLEAATYGRDVQCQLLLMRDPREKRSDPVLGWISERLLARLKHLALGYELPLLKRLPSVGVEIYPDIQVQDLEILKTSWRSCSASFRMMFSSRRYPRCMR